MHRLYNMIFYYLWVFFCRDAIILRLYNNSFFSDVWCCVSKMFYGRDELRPYGSTTQICLLDYEYMYLYINKICAII